MPIEFCTRAVTNPADVASLQASIQCLPLSYRDVSLSANKVSFVRVNHPRLTLAFLKNSILEKILGIKYLTHEPFVSQVRNQYRIMDVALKLTFRKGQCQPCVEGLPLSPTYATAKWLSRAERERDFFIDNLLVRIHVIIEMIWWTGLAPLEFE